MMWLCFFFIFKQKTAYEMRISDWSSDVCSSDLALPQLRGEPRRIALPSLRAERRYPPQLWRDRARPCPRDFSFRGQAVAHAALARMAIGRASCRERGCKYV